MGIFGPEKTGKSFLANTLLNRIQGFDLGGGSRPCTKGIWIWGRPIIKEDEATVIFDTQGLNDGASQDQLFQMGLLFLVSSVLVFNR